MPRQSWSRWKELNRHRSIINRVLWPLSYTARLVDPTGLKPAPHGLKGRRSVTRAPGQRDWLWRKGSNLRIGRINSAVPYQLGYATKSESGCGDETRTRTPSFTRRVLCYPIELRRNLVDWEGFKPSQEVCRTSMLSLHHQPNKFGGCGWSRTTNLALMRRLLFPLELHSRKF